MALPSSHHVHPQHNSFLELASRHGLNLTGALDFNELGLDFQVATAIDESGVEWILRIPRRPDVFPKIEREARALSFLKTRVPFTIPDWRIVSTEIIAYPKLNDPTAISVDSATHDFTWNIDRDTDAFASSLGGALAALHGISRADAIEAGLKETLPFDERMQIKNNIDLVNSQFEIAPELKRRWLRWVDDDSLWPEHSVVVHGDLYAGHVLVNEKNGVSGMIDWTEAAINDPSIDFTSHLLLFGEPGLASLIHHYEVAGGKVWPRMASHVVERLALLPIQYALFVLESGDESHRAIVKEQLLQG